MTTPPRSAAMDVSQLRGCARCMTMPASIACWQASSGSSVGTSALGGSGAAQPPLETASHLERLHELAQAFLVGGFHDHVHRVLAVHDGFALDLQAELPDIRST